MPTAIHDRQRRQQASAPGARQLLGHLAAGPGQAVDAEPYQSFDIVTDGRHEQAVLDRTTGTQALTDAGQDGCRLRMPAWTRSTEPPAVFAMSRQKPAPVTSVSW